MLRPSSFLLSMVMLLKSCDFTPAPAVMKISEIPREVARPSNAISSDIETLTGYLTSILQEKAGLKIAGVIMTPSEFSQVFARPKKTEALLVLRVKELAITVNTGARSGEAKLVLGVIVFDGQGRAIHEQTVTSVRAGPITINEVVPGTSELLELVAKDALKQCIKDPALRAIIMKYKYPTLATFL